MHDAKRTPVVSAAAAVVSAVTGLFTLAVAIGTALIAWHYYQTSVDEAENKIAADTVFEWYHREPLNTRPCLDFMKKLETNDWCEIAKRHELQLAPELRESVLACLSDQNATEISELYDLPANKLTRRGASFVAHRANRMLGADDLVARFMLSKIGNTDLYRPIVYFICKYDISILDNAPQIPAIQKSFLSLRQFIEWRDGCNTPLRKRAAETCALPQ